MLSPALFQKRNLKWLSVIVLLIAMNFAVIWLWGAFLTLRFQRYLMYLGYLPVDSRRNVPHPHIRTPINAQESEKELGLIHDTLVESIYLKSADGTRLHAHFYRFPSENLYPPRPSGKLPPTVLFFHGTSGNIAHRVGYAHTLSTLGMCNVMLLNCRGYGLSDGEAHRKGIQQDTQAALEYLKSGARKDVDPKRLFVLGQSMGGAFAIDLATRNPEAFLGLIIDNTFTSITDLLPEVLPPFAPIRDYVTENWDSLKALHECPAEKFPAALFLIGDQDELINSSHGKALYHAAAEKVNRVPDLQVRLLLFPYGYHVHTFREPFYFDAVAQFVNQINAQIK